MILTTLPEYTSDTTFIQHPNQLISRVDLSPFINLIILNLSYNNITQININIPRIKIVNLEHNRLTYFKIWTPSLNILNISNNFIKDLVVKSPNITNLNAAYNPIRRFYSWPKHYILNLEGCHLKKWTCDFGEVNLNNSRIRVIKAHIRTLHISGCNIKYIKGTFVQVFGMKLPRGHTKGIKLG